MASQGSESDRLRVNLRRGDPGALAEIWSHYRLRLRQMLRLRIDSRVAARVVASNVLQDVYLDAQRQLPAYLEGEAVGCYVWLRGLAEERLWNVHREHLGAKRRSAWREVELPQQSSAMLARQLVAGGSTPSRALRDEELRLRVQQALAQLPADDREVILMRHFEDMSNREVAETLGLSDSGATKRYGRAIFRLKQLLLGDPQPGESRP